MATPSMDTGDRDRGDYDSTEVSQAFNDVWHPSHSQVCLVDLPKATETGRKQCKAVLAILPRKAPNTASRPFFRTGCWSDTPEGIKRLIVKSAGLEAAVAAKLDRDLTETEKARIRETARRLIRFADQVCAL